MTKKNKEAKKGFWAFLPLHSASCQKEKGTMGLPKASLVIASVRGNRHALKGSTVERACIYIYMYVYFIASVWKGDCSRPFL